MLFAVAIALIFFYAPWSRIGADQGLSQRIFYFHVPIALTAYVAFGWGAWKALRYLWKRDEEPDLESYVAIHQGVIFGSLDAAHRLDLGEDLLGRLVGLDRRRARALPRALPLLLRLLHAALLGRSGRRARANMCAVYALFGVVLIPISFFAIRLSRSIIHPEVFTCSGPQMTHSQFIDLLRLVRRDALLFATLYRIELAGKRLDTQLRELRELLA